MSQRQLVRGLKDKETVDSTYLVKEKFLGVGKNGRSFLTILLGDQTGSIDAKVWDRVEEISAEFETGDVVHIKGAIQIFQNRRQLVVHKLTFVDPATIDMNEFLVKSQRQPEDMFIDLKQIVLKIQNTHIQQLVLATIEDQDIRPLLLNAPAAKSVHHAWSGGLIEHMLSISQLMLSIGQHYHFLNLDFLIFGAIYHDIGKIWELDWQQGIKYTDRGRLLGHLYMGCELVEKKSSRILGFPDDLKDLLKHIVLSHHNLLEYGSPKQPQFLEAVVVAMVDDFDSKMSTIHSFIDSERASGDKWSRYNDLFERYFLLEDIQVKYK